MPNPYKTHHSKFNFDKSIQDWYKDIVGGLWEEMGELQFDFMKKNGLKPHHSFLDVGCGCLRGGIHFIEYLEKSHYYGIDLLRDLLDVGQEQLEKLNLITKKPTLTQLDRFEFKKLNQNFDFALAISVFTHMPINDIITCLMRIQDVMKEGGRFYATYFENKKGKYCLDPIKRIDQINRVKFITFFDDDPYHYDLNTFKWICEGTNLSVKKIGEWNHPRTQQMLLFEKKTTSIIKTFSLKK